MIRVIFMLFLYNPANIKASFPNSLFGDFPKLYGESTEEYCTRIFELNGETNANYVKRIDNTFALNPENECYDMEFWPLAETYYKLKYGRIEDLYPGTHEHEDEYYTRILKSEPGEEFEAYIARMDRVYQAYPRLNIWRKIQFDKQSKNWYFYRNVDYSANIKPSLNIKESLYEKYARREEEEGDDYTYFKRICKRKLGESDQDYVDRMTKLERHFTELSLWYSDDYLELSKPYYNLKYNKGDKEDLINYCKRITEKRVYEDLKNYVRRLSFLEDLFGSLPIWNNEEFLQFTKTFYKAVYGRKRKETAEAYLKRVISKTSFEEIDNYAKRVNVIRWINKNTDLFYNPKYLTYTKTYFDIFYGKDSSESVEKWLARIFKRNIEETDKEYVKRMAMVISVHKDLIDANSEKYKKYASEYLKLSNKTNKSIH